MVSQVFQRFRVSCNTRYWLALVVKCLMVKLALIGLPEICGGSDCMAWEGVSASLFRFITKVTHYGGVLSIVNSAWLECAFAQRFCSLACFCIFLLLICNCVLEDCSNKAIALHMH